MGRIPVLGPLTANNGHRERIHVAALHLCVHATRVLLDAAAERASRGFLQPHATLKLEHLIPTERKAFRHSLRARMRAKFSQQGLDVEFNGM